MTLPIYVIRLSQRGYRDLRVTTHCCLVARAFGTQKIILDENQPREIQQTVQKITNTFGGTFDVEYTQSPAREIKRLKKEGNTIVHLTMYGESPRKKMNELRKKKKGMVIVVGAHKVPAEIYHLADYNISITRQPHSEIAALGVFLHQLTQGKEETLEFEGARRKIIPQKKGKKVISSPN